MKKQIFERARYNGLEWSTWMSGHPDDTAEVLILVEDIQNREHFMSIALWEADENRWYTHDDLRVICWKRLPDMPEV